MTTVRWQKKSYIGWKKDSRTFLRPWREYKRGSWTRKPTNGTKRSKRNTKKHKKRINLSFLKKKKRVKTKESTLETPRARTKKWKI
jgi:hypothetical protein